MHNQFFPFPRGKWMGLSDPSPVARDTVVGNLVFHYLFRARPVILATDIVQNYFFRTAYETRKTDSVSKLIVDCFREGIFGILCYKGQTLSDVKNGFLSGVGTDGYYHTQDWFLNNLDLEYFQKLAYDAPHESAFEVPASEKNEVFTVAIIDLLHSQHCDLDDRVRDHVLRNMEMLSRNEPLSWSHLNYQGVENSANGRGLNGLTADDQAAAGTTLHWTVGQGGAIATWADISGMGAAGVGNASRALSFVHKAFHHNHKAKLSVSDRMYNRMGKEQGQDDLAHSIFPKFLVRLTAKDIWAIRELPEAKDYFGYLNVSRAGKESPYLYPAYFQYFRKVRTILAQRYDDELLLDARDVSGRLAIWKSIAGVGLSRTLDAINLGGPFSIANDFSTVLRTRKLTQPRSMAEIAEDETGALVENMRASDQRKMLDGSYPKVEQVHEHESVRFDTLSP